MPAERGGRGTVFLPPPPPPHFLPKSKTEQKQEKTMYKYRIHIPKLVKIKINLNFMTWKMSIHSSLQMSMTFWATIRQTEKILTWSKAQKHEILVTNLQKVFVNLQPLSNLILSKKTAAPYQNITCLNFLVSPGTRKISWNQRVQWRFKAARALATDLSWSRSAQSYVGCANPSAQQPPPSAT